MTAHALLAQDILGTGTQVYGAPVGPTTPTASMSVFVGAGRIYSMAALEPSAWSSLAADSTPVLKQGILTSAGATIPCPVLGTTGQSVNYLVEGQYQELDLNPVTLSYYNAANPSQPYSGAGNNGIAQPTVRAGQFVVQAIAGTPATTGSQASPAATSGWVPLAVVTVAFGQTTIVAGNISIAPGAPYVAGAVSGSFTATYVGGTTAPTQLAYYSTSGPFASLILPQFGAVTSNANHFSYMGMPAFLIPATPLQFQQIPVAAGTDNSVAIAGVNANIGTTGIVFSTLSGTTGWTASGIKSVQGSLMYRLY
jgi:hypothetical protein